MKRTYAVIGDDPRQTRLAELLAAAGYAVFRAAPGEPPPYADAVIWGLPMRGADLTPFKREQKLFGGMVPVRTLETAERLGLTLIDYARLETFAARNALPTAEGALFLAMRETNSVIFGAEVLIIGVGRVGKELARVFGGVGASVWGHDKNAFPDVSVAVLPGLGGGALKRFDIIINTAPAPVLGEELIKGVKPSCLIIDLASAPGGVNAAAAREAGIKCLTAPGLPMMYAPDTAARVLFGVISEFAD